MTPVNQWHTTASTTTYCSTLTALSYIPEVESGFLLVVVSSFTSFTFFCISNIINSLFVSWSWRTVCFFTVPYAASRRRMFLDGCWVLPFAWMITIGLLVLVLSNWIGASVSSEILLMPFEDVWIEATYVCVFVFVLGGLRGSRWFLAKLSLMMFPYDTVKAYHVSTSI